MDNQNNITPVSENQPLTEDTKTIVTVLLLVTFFPIGIVLMWIWTKWQLWVKALITGCGCLPIILFIAFFAVGIMVSESDNGNNKNNKSIDYSYEEKPNDFNDYKTIPPSPPLNYDDIE